jgi:hypothetical protein
MKISKYLLEIVVFVCGAVVMIFELVGSRVLGPYFGTSIFEYRTRDGVDLSCLYKNVKGTKRQAIYPYRA